MIWNFRVDQKKNYKIWTKSDNCIYLDWILIWNFGLDHWVGLLSWALKLNHEYEWLGGRFCPKQDYFISRLDQITRRKPSIFAITRFMVFSGGIRIRTKAVKKTPWSVSRPRQTYRSFAHWDLIWTEISLHAYMLDKSS